MALMIKMVRIVYFVVLLLAINNRNNAANGAIGLNWGRQSAQRLIPSTVVDLLLQNGMKEARIFSSQEDILMAFAGSGINLSISVFNAALLPTYESALAWTGNKGRKYFTAANVRRVIFGNNPFYDGLAKPASLDFTLNVMEFTDKALKQFGFGYIETAVPVSHVILKDNITKPSEAEFRAEIKDQMLRYLRFQQANNGPFLIDFFPIYYVTNQSIDLSFAFADNKSTHVVQDMNGAVYTNAFEFMFDSFVWALRKVNASDLKIVMAQVGWPTDGYPGATASTAEHFFKYFLPLVASNKGTPMRPGKPIDTYVHCLSDENKMPFEYPFSRHWGIYRSNGEPKYKIDLSGQGQDIFPARARGIMRMPERWCVFNGDMRGMAALMKEYEVACKNADCTSLAPGGSCSQLNFSQRISYAFNMYFQAMFQSNEGCKFGGFGMVIEKNNPSNGTCVFPVEPVQGQQEQFTAPAKASSDGGRSLRRAPEGFAAIFLVLLSALLFLF